MIVGFHGWYVELQKKRLSEQLELNIQVIPVPKPIMCLEVQADFEKSKHVLMTKCGGLWKTRTG